MSLALLFHNLLLNMFRMLVHPSSGACDLLWIYFMCCVELVRCVLVLRCGSAGVVWYPYAGFWAVNNEIIKQVTSSWSVFIQLSYTIVRILQNSVICLLYAGSLRKPNCKLVADINIDCTKTGSKNVGWTEPAQNRILWRAVVNVVMNRRFPIKGLGFSPAKRLSVSKTNALHGFNIFCM